MSIMDFYKSMTVDYRLEEEDIVVKSVEQGIVPDRIRYGVMNGTMRGIIKTANEDMYYFNFVPGNNFKISKADDDTKIWEANRLLQRCQMGCDLMKGSDDEVIEDYDEEETEKAEEGGGGDGGPTAAVLPRIPEDQAIQAQQRIMTERHPGAAMGTTPDRPEVGRLWHEETVKSGFWNRNTLLKGLGNKLQAQAAERIQPVTSPERQFMLEVLGRTPDQIGAGDTYMNPTQKVLFARWMGKSLDTKIDGLAYWLNSKDNG